MYTILKTIVFICVASCAVTCWALEGPQVVGSMVLRRLAVVTTLPDYPSASFSNGVQGLVVVAVICDRDANVSGADILQSPDEATAAATIAAVKRWKFRRELVQQGSSRRSVTGRLLFYFRIVNGKPMVIDGGGEIMKAKVEQYDK